MAGISQNCKTGDVSLFGDCVGSASRALCGLTEAAGQVKCVEEVDKKTLLCSAGRKVIVTEAADKV